MLFYLDSLQVDILKQPSKIGDAEVGDQVKFGVDPTGPTGGSLLANLNTNSIFNGKSSTG